MHNQKYNPWESNKQENNLHQRFSSQYALTDIDFKRLLYTWHYVLFFGIFGVIIGKIYTRYITTTYTVSTKINIQQKEEITIQQAVSGNSRDPFNDRIAFLKSPALLINTVDNLNLCYTAALKGKFKDKSLYKIINWEIVDKKKYNDLPNISFVIEPINNKLYLKTKYGKKQEFKFNSIIKFDSFNIRIDSIRPFSYNSPIVFEIFDSWKIANEISNNLNIKAAKESNIIDITYSDISNERAKDVLYNLVKTYNNILIKDKSLGFSQAIDFINSRIEPLAKELDSIENSLANYQSEKGFVNEESNGKLYLDKVNEYDKKLIDIEIQQSNIDSLEHYVFNNSNSDFNYNFTGISDVNLQNNISFLQKLKLEKERLKTILSSSNPTLINLENSIREIKNNIKKQITSIRESINVSKKICIKRIDEANSMIKKTPFNEKNLIDIKRMRNIKEALFLTLLQKREEAGIAKASTTIDTKILNPPTIVPSQQKPSKSIIILLSGLIGMCLPIIFFLTKEFLNNKIISSKQLENYLKIPVLAELEFLENKNNKGIFSRSMIGEQLRSLRTQLDFYKNDKKNLVILVTSNMSGEGKSFVSVNLAKVFSLQNKKVALLEFDLRKPKLSKELGVENKVGLSNFLIKQASMEDILKKPIKEYDSFHFYPSGPIPPNPQELLSNDNLENLQKYLQENYEIVIVDTPPFGIVADAQLLAKIANLTIVITRFNYTYKEQIIEIDKWNKSNLFPSLNLILNGIKNNGYYGYRYGYYYYKQKYGYDYYKA